MFIWADTRFDGGARTLPSLQPGRRRGHVQTLDTRLTHARYSARSRHLGDLRAERLRLAGVRIIRDRRAEEGSRRKSSGTSGTSFVRRKDVPDCSVARACTASSPVRESPLCAWEEQASSHAGRVGLPSRATMLPCIRPFTPFLRLRCMRHCGPLLITTVSLHPGRRRLFWSNIGSAFCRDEERAHHKLASRVWCVVNAI